MKFDFALCVEKRKLFANKSLPPNYSTLVVETPRLTA